VFHVPNKLYRTLDRDLAAAGIPKRDADGKQIDVHALRHTFGTLLSVGGVAPRTAQAAMRHSELRMTMNVYTDPRLLDTAGALNALPSLPLDASPLPLLLPQTGGISREQMVTGGKIKPSCDEELRTEVIDAKPYFVERRTPPTTDVIGGVTLGEINKEVAAVGIEPTTSRL